MVNQYNSELNGLLNAINILPKFIILNTSSAVRKLQAIFPFYDVSPIIADLINAINNNDTAANHLKSSIAMYLDAIYENDLIPSAHLKDEQVRRVNSLDLGVTFEQACLDLVDIVNNSNVKIYNRYLIYKFHSLNPDGSLVLEKHYDFDEVCDELFGK